MSLREITKDLHHEAETTKFAKELLSGKIGGKKYVNYLYNLLAIYDPIEWYAGRQGMFEKMPYLPRLRAIHADFKELDDGGYLYCRHMGDLHGGQIIKKQVAHISSGKFYDFNDADALKIQIRQELTDDLGDEARLAFEYAIRMMKDLYDGE